MADDATTACGGDPNFAVICSFMQRYGEILGVPQVSLTNLEKYLNDTSYVSKVLIDIFIKLLRRWKNSIHSDKWEKYLIKYCYTYSEIDAWELEKFGFPRIKLSTKLRMLKNLLETQFDCNSKFKEKINEKVASELRVHCVGRDRQGLAYWLLRDTDLNIRVYREEQDDEDAKSWEIVVSSRNGLAKLIENLDDKKPDKEEGSEGSTNGVKKEEVESDIDSEESKDSILKDGSKLTYEETKEGIRKENVEETDENHKPAIKLSLKIKEEPPDPPPSGQIEEQLDAPVKVESEEIKPEPGNGKGTVEGVTIKEETGDVEGSSPESKSKDESSKVVEDPETPQASRDDTETRAKGQCTAEDEAVTPTASRSSETFANDKALTQEESAKEASEGGDQCKTSDSKEEVRTHSEDEAVTKQKEDRQGDCNLTNEKAGTAGSKEQTLNENDVSFNSREPESEYASSRENDAKKKMSPSVSSQDEREATDSSEIDVGTEDNLVAEAAGLVEKENHVATGTLATVTQEGFSPKKAHEKLAITSTEDVVEGVGDMTEDSSSKCHVDKVDSTSIKCDTDKADNNSIICDTDKADDNAVRCDTDMADDTLIKCDMDRTEDSPTKCDRDTTDNTSSQSDKDRTDNTSAICDNDLPVCTEKDTERNSTPETNISPDGVKSSSEQVEGSARGKGCSEERNLCKVVAPDQGKIPGNEVDIEKSKEGDQKNTKEILSTDATDEQTGKINSVEDTKTMENGPDVHAPESNNKLDQTPDECSKQLKSDKCDTCTDNLTVSPAANDNREVKKVSEAQIGEELVDPTVQTGEDQVKEDKICLQDNSKVDIKGEGTNEKTGEVLVKSETNNVQDDIITKELDKTELSRQDKESQDEVDVTAEEEKALKDQEPSSKAEVEDGKKDKGAADLKKTEKGNEEVQQHCEDTKVNGDTEVRSEAETDRKGNDAIVQEPKLVPGAEKGDSPIQNHKQTVTQMVMNESSKVDSPSPTSKVGDSADDVSSIVTSNRKRGRSDGEVPSVTREAVNEEEEEEKVAPQKRKRALNAEAATPLVEETKAKQRQARKRKESGGSIHSSESEESESDEAAVAVDSDEPPSKRKKGRRLKTAAERNEEAGVASHGDSSEESEEANTRRPSMGKGRGRSARGSRGGRGRGGGAVNIGRGTATAAADARVKKDDESEQSGNESGAASTDKIHQKEAVDQKENDAEEAEIDEKGEQEDPKAKTPTKKRGRGRKGRRSEEDAASPVTPIRRSSRSTKGKRGAVFLAGPDESIKRKKKVPPPPPEVTEIVEEIEKKKHRKKRNEEEEEAKTKKKRKSGRSHDEEWDPKRPGAVKGRGRRRGHASSESSTDDDEDILQVLEEDHEDESLHFTETEPELEELDSDGSEYEPQGRNAKRAAALKQKAAEEAALLEDDGPCSRCGKPDHPEWILLCDKCDAGFHTACLRPPLMMIPDGDWFCPSCEHAQLLEKLMDSLRELDVQMKKNERLVKRKERLAYVGISLNNILPDKEEKTGRKRRARIFDDSDETENSEEDDETEDDEDDDEEEEGDDDDDDDDGRSVEDSEEGTEEESESESEKSHFVKRSRRARKEISYRFTEFDNLINRAIQGDVREYDGEEPPPPPPRKPGPVSRGKDMDTIMSMHREEEEAEALAASWSGDKQPAEGLPGQPVAGGGDSGGGGTESSTVADKEETAAEEKPDLESSRPSPVAQKARGRRKGRRLTALDDSEDSPDDDSESYKASEDSAASDLSYEELSDDVSEEEDWDRGTSGRRSGGRRTASRKSTRTHRRGYKYDDFVVDEDDSDSDGVTRRSSRSSARRGVSYRELASEDDEEESDVGYGRVKKRRPKLLSKVKSKKKRRIVRSFDDDDDSDDLEIGRSRGGGGGSGGRRKRSAPSGRRYEDDSDYNMDDLVGKRRSRSNVNYRKLLGSDSDEEEDEEEAKGSEKSAKSRPPRRNVVQSDSEYSADTDNYFEDEEDEEDKEEEEKVVKKPKKRTRNPVGKSEESEDEDDDQTEKDEDEDGSTDDAGGKGRLEQYRTKRPAIVSSRDDSTVRDDSSTAESAKINGHAVPCPAPCDKKLDIEGLLGDAKGTAGGGGAEEVVAAGGGIDDDIAQIDADDADLDSIEDLVNYVTMD